MSKFRDYINEHYTARDAYRHCFGVDAPLGKDFCKFHDNRNTPAAKMYDFGYKCFGECNRVFTAWDFFHEFDPAFLQKLKQEVVLVGETSSVIPSKVKDCIISDEVKSSGVWGILQELFEYYKVDYKS